MYGLANVRVVDAGVIPLTIGGPPQQTVYAIAEKVCVAAYTQRQVTADLRLLSGIGFDPGGSSPVLMQKRGPP